VLAAEEVRPDDGDHAQHQGRRQTLLRWSRIAVLLFASECLERFLVFGGDARLIKSSFLRVPILLECIPRLQASVDRLVGLACLFWVCVGFLRAGLGAGPYEQRRTKRGLRAECAPGLDGAFSALLF